MITSGSIIPNNWRQIKLKYAAQLVSSRADSRPDGLPYVGMENIESHTGRLKSAQYQDDEQPPDGISTVNLFGKGDDLFGKLRPYLAKGWLCDFSGASTTETLVLRPGPDINPRYLSHTILSRDFIREVDTTTFGDEELLSVSHLTGVTSRSEKSVNMFMAESLEGYKRCEAGDLVINTLWAWMGAMGVARQAERVSQSLRLPVASYTVPGL